MKKWDIFKKISKHCDFPYPPFFELFFIFEDSKVQYKAAYINLVSASDVASREYPAVSQMDVLVGKKA